jgi:hypothetical protein
MAVGKIPAAVELSLCPARMLQSLGGVSRRQAGDPEKNEREAS